MRTGVSVDEALRLVLAQAEVLPQETVATRDALGRILAESVVSSRTLPPADVSAMDGYAVRASDLRSASRDRPAELRVEFEVAAGATPGRSLLAGEAARIFTGAALPRGADAVVRQEDTERRGERVLIFVASEPGTDVRPAGEDVRAGDGVLEPGTRLGPAQLGLLAALGRSVVAVRQRPRAAILSGGDELVETDAEPSEGRIVSSNSYSLAAQCREVGAEPVYLGIARDSPEELERRLRAGLRADVLVSSGGVSVGDRDYVRPVLEKIGCQLLLWGVQMKPGFPFAFGRLEAGPLVFGLPGNPVSAMVTFEQFVRPVLRKLAGHSRWFRPRLGATLAHPLRKRPGRLEFVRVRLERRGQRIWAASTGTQSSGVLRSMALAHGLLLFPAHESELPAESPVTVQLLDEEFLGESDSGL